jgi:hypothetical protein
LASASSAGVTRSLRIRAISARSAASPASAGLPADMIAKATKVPGPCFISLKLDASLAIWLR